MQLRALTFDIIGTVFNVYDGLAQGVGPLNVKYGVGVNGAAFASGSLSGYSTGIGQVLSSGNWVPPDTILQKATRANLPIQQLGTEADTAVQDFAGLWHALRPWSDVAAGMDALHRHYTLAVLSNMSITTQAALRAHATLPFDNLLSAETVRQYKPNAAVYQLAISSLTLEASEILMVAAHNYLPRQLLAQRCGRRGAYRSSARQADRRNCGRRANLRAPLRRGARHAGVPFAGFWPDHRVGIELPQSTRIVQRKRGLTSNVGSMMVLRARRGGTGSK
jgi:2-haloacid dehalogenase